MDYTKIVYTRIIAWVRSEPARRQVTAARQYLDAALDGPIDR